ncbi:MAG: sigma-70 family RNA polymerase sigma factor [Oscillospiraceae bacterium]
MEKTFLAKMMTEFLPYIKHKACGSNPSGLESDDLIQEGFIGLFNAIESYDKSKGAAFSTYAITCIDNSIKSAQKAAQRKKHSPLNGYVSLCEDAESPTLISAYSPEDLAILREECDALQQKIDDNLSAFERAVLALHLEGYDYSSSAKRLGKTPKSVDNALQRARKKLKSQA